MEEPLPILRKRIEVLKQEAGAALLDWYETTHGNTIGEHDHHCRASRWELRPHPSITISAGPNKGQPLMQNIEVGTGKPCTCGWSKAEAALKALHEREAERGA